MERQRQVSEQRARRCGKAELRTFGCLVKQLGRLQNTVLHQAGSKRYGILLFAPGFQEASGNRRCRSRLRLPTGRMTACFFRCLFRRFAYLRTATLEGMHRAGTGLCKRLREKIQIGQAGKKGQRQNDRNESSLITHVHYPKAKSLLSASALLGALNSKGPTWDFPCCIV